MILNFLPMLSDQAIEGPSPEGVVAALSGRVRTDESLGELFDSFRYLEPVRVPPIEELSKKSRKGGLLGLISGFYLFSGKIPYGDMVLTGIYTYRFMRETSDDLGLEALPGRTLILTDVRIGRYNPVDLDIYEQREGSALSPHVALLSYFGSSDGPSWDETRLFKHAKHELGHIMGMQHCRSGPCVMNREMDVNDRPISYCEEHKSIMRDFLEKESLRYGASSSRDR